MLCCFPPEKVTMKQLILVGLCIVGHLVAAEAYRDLPQLPQYPQYPQQVQAQAQPQQWVPSQGQPQQWAQVRNGYEGQVRGQQQSGAGQEMPQYEIQGIWQTKVQEAVIWRNHNVTHLKNYQTNGAFVGKWGKKAGGLLQKLMSGNMINAGNTGPAAHIRVARDTSATLRRSKRVRRQAQGTPAPPGGIPSPPGEMPKAPGGMPTVPDGAGGPPKGGDFLEGIKKGAENVGSWFKKAGKKVGDFFKNLGKKKDPKAPGAPGVPGDPKQAAAAEAAAAAEKMPGMPPPPSG